MKYIYRTSIKLLMLLVLVFSTASCDLFNLDINKDPNNPTAASLNLLLSQVEYRAAELMAGGVNDDQHGFVGILASFDSFGLSNPTYNFFWNQMYAGPLKDIDEIIKATEGKNNPHYLGIAQILKAYYFSTMVDLFGDIPFSLALQGNTAGGTKQPSYDDDAAIYAECFSLIDQGIANLTLPTPVTVTGDIIYGASAAKWRRFAKSLKLKMLVQTRRTDPAALTKINTAISAGDLITATADDFIFQFSRLVNPDNRHPWYQQGYLGANGFTYILHQYMVEMLEDEDPRTPFYFRRQTEKLLDQNNPSEKATTPCSQTTGCIYNYLVLNQNVIDRLYTNKGKPFGDAEKKFLAGFFGRDRGDPAGIPLDGDLRTIPGAYPAAGFYDKSTAGLPGANLAAGNGIFPMLTSVNVQYYQIEAILALGVAGNARTIFEAAIRSHIAKVSAYGLSFDPANSITPTMTAIDAYVNRWLTRYDAAASNEAKLNVVMKQLWFSSWGNGYEIYNAMRRTGYPNTVQTPIFRSRQFALRLPYPQDDLTLNPNAPASPAIFDVDPVFWDTLKFKF